MDAPSKPVDHTRRGWAEAVDEWRALRERLRDVDDELRRLSIRELEERR
jgi:hypothetical protein